MEGNIWEGRVNMDDEQVMHGMGIDDAYRVERVLSNRRGFVTERVTLDGSGPYIRKKMPLDQANRAVWAALASCGCKRLPQVIASYELPDKFVVVCSYVPGETLADRLGQRGRLEQSEAVRVALDLCEAAASLHAHGIVHCDITPSNIVLAADGAHLVDMGIARIMSDSAPSQAGRMGTRGYASPEQCFAAADARSDVYAIGRVLGAMLTGVHPDDASYGELLADDAAVPASLREVIEHATAFEPSARFADVDALARTLGNDREMSASQQVMGKTPDLSRRPKALRPAIAIGGIIVLCMLGVAVALPALRRQQDGPQPEADAAPADVQPEHEQADQAPSDVVDAQGDEDNATGDIDAQKAHDALAISESWWQPSDNGLFTYMFALTNTSDDIAIDYPAVHITGKDASGAVVANVEDGAMTIAPGQTIYKFGVAGNGTMPETVEFTADLTMDEFARGQTDEPSVLTVTGAQANKGMFGTAVTGELTAEHIGSDAAISTGAAVTVILRSETGSIVGGTTDYCSLPSEGETVPFETAPFDAPEYASMEVYAIPW